jgi:hypothetical protein
LEGKESDVKTKRSIFRKLKKVIWKNKYNKYNSISHKYYDFSPEKIEADKKF